MRFAPCLLLCLATVAGCAAARNTVPIDPNPQPIDAAVNTDDSGNIIGEDCVDAARWIYLVADDQSLVRFEPDTKTLTNVGTLNCNAGATPFSMAVDRHAMAWVLHNDGKIYKADVTDASCTSTTFVPGQMGIGTFGMGFVSNAAGSEEETLFIAAATDPSFEGDATLATINTDTLTITTIGTVNGSPELTGNGAAELWAFSPNVSPKTVVKFNKETGAAIQTFEVNALGNDSGIGGSAWAFAFWGGRYYMFYKGGGDASTSIWSLDPGTGAVTSVLTDIGLVIVGAGVSTCAPIQVI